MGRTMTCAIHALTCPTQPTNQRTTDMSTSTNTSLQGEQGSSVPQSEQTRKKRTKVVIGEVYGRLTVLEELPPHIKPSGVPIKRFLCQCSCGRIVPILGQHLTGQSGSRSCGCLRSERTSAAAKTHGFSSHPLWPVWCGMHARCTAEYVNGSENYLGRGITVCERWQLPAEVGFVNFTADLGERPEGHTLERIDNQLGYSPENCKWAKRGLQNYNKRKHKNNTSGRTGVYLHPNGRFIAIIGVNNSYKSLGSFKTFEEAVAAREQAEVMFYGFTKE